MKHLLILLLIPLTAQAQSIHFSAGAALPTGHLGDYWNLGYGVNTGFNFKVVGPLDLGLAFGYASFGLDRETIAAESGAGTQVSISGGQIATMYLFAEGRLWLAQNARVAPYVVYAAGGYRYDVERLTLGAWGYSETVGGETGNRIGLQAGAGIAYAIAPSTSVTLDARYTIGLRDSGGKHTTHVPVSLGISQKLNLYTRN